MTRPGALFVWVRDTSCSSYYTIPQYTPRDDRNIEPLDFLYGKPHLQQKPFFWPVSQMYTNELDLTLTITSNQICSIFLVDITGVVVVVSFSPPHFGVGVSHVTILYWCSNLLKFASFFFFLSKSISSVGRVCAGIPLSYGVFSWWVFLSFGPFEQCGVFMQTWLTTKIFEEPGRRGVSNCYFRALEGGVAGDYRE